MDRSVTALAFVLLSSSFSSAAPQPFSVPASQYWDGDDGQWSTFSFQVGNPFQQVRLLPSTSASTFAPILNTACTSNDSTSCPQNRGGTYNPSASSSWSAVGIYQYITPFSQQGLLGNTANASYGFDTIQLAWPGSPAPTLQDQVISGLQTDDTDQFFYLGQFGLSPRALNISTLDNSHQSPVASLKAGGLIPSTTWAYTAGYHNTDPPAFGSLTLGGYDTTRFRSNNITFPFGPDISRDLLVGIQQVSSDKANGPLLTDPVYAFIDSSVPGIWLPTSACQAFEQAFNLTYYNEGAQGYYLLTDQQHQSLTNMNPSVTFTLGPSLAGGSTVDVTLPYGAFDLQLSPPLGQNGTYYFPLQRAANSSQYVLGRTFLQHAYVIADYDRSNFSVSQALFPQDTSSQILAIQPPGGSGSGNSTSSGSQQSSGLSGGAIAGVVIGVLAGLGLIAGALVFFFIRRRRQRQQQQAATELENTHPSGEQAPPYHSIYEKAELGNDGNGRAEADGHSVLPKQELGSDFVASNELEAADKTHRTELADGQGLRPELDAGQTVSEMDGQQAEGKKGSRRANAGPVYELA